MRAQPICSREPIAPDDAAARSAARTRSRGATKTAPGSRPAGGAGFAAGGAAQDARRRPRIRATAPTTRLIPPAARKVALFFLNDTATTEIYTLSLHDALPI